MASVTRRYSPSKVQAPFAETPILAKYSLPQRVLQAEGPPGIANTLDGGVVDKPAASLSRPLVDQSAWQALVALENLPHDLLLAGARGDKRNADGVVHDGQREGDASRWRLGRVLDGGDPGARLAQQCVAGE